MSHSTEDDAEGDPGEDVGVVTLAGVERLAVEGDGIEGTAAREHTSALNTERLCEAAITTGCNM